MKFNLSSGEIHRNLSFNAEDFKILSQRNSQTYSHTDLFNEELDKIDSSNLIIYNNFNI